MSSGVDLFVYRTLMDKSLVHQITGKHFSTSPAYLKDFRKLPSKFGYSHILPHKGSQVEGLLITGIDPGSMKRIDHYEEEGRLYFRKKITVVSNGKTIACEAYVGNSKILGPRS